MKATHILWLKFMKLTGKFCFHRKAEVCDEDPTDDPPKVVKNFNRSLLFDAVSRAEPEALDGLLEYLKSRDKRLTDEEFRGEARIGRKRRTSVPTPPSTPGLLMQSRQD